MNITCNLCGSNNPKKLYNKNKFDILKCNDCGLIFTNFPDNLSIEKIYTGDYFEGGAVDGYANYGSTEAILKKEFTGNFNKLKTLKKQNSNLLELGCAYGFFLDIAKNYFKCSGIEISEHAANIAISKNLNVKQGDFLKLQDFVNEQYDIIAMFDLIEHLSDPRNTIKKIHEKLAPEGVIIITTGDVGSVLSKIMKKNWRLLTPPQHLFYFSKKTIRMLLEQNGFKILSIDYPFKFVPLSLITYQLTRITKINFKFLNIPKFGLYINLFDSMRIIAVKIS